MTDLRVIDLDPDGFIDRLDDLAALLHTVVMDGAAVSFVWPFELPESRRFWVETVLPPLKAGTRTVLVAEAAGRLVGTVQLGIDTPPNQPHRCDVSKLLVDPAYRRRGVARMLMDALEFRARSLDRRLITLDTRTGDSAEPLYQSLGYVSVGVIPGFAFDPDRSATHGTTVMYKAL